MVANFKKDSRWWLLMGIILTAGLGIVLLTNESRKVINKSSVHHDSKESDRQRQQAMVKKLQTIMIKQCNFKEAPITSVIDFLRQESKKADPDQEGVIINYKPSTLDLGGVPRVGYRIITPVPLADVINNITEFAYPPLKYRIDPHSIVIGVDVIIRSQEMIVPIAPIVIQPPTSSEEAKRFLEENLDVQFEHGTSVVYHKYDDEYWVMTLTHFEGVLRRVEGALSDFPYESKRVFEKLNSIFVDIDFTEVSIRKAIENLAEKSKAADSWGNWIDIKLHPAFSNTKVTLQLKKVLLLEALEQLTKISGAEYVINPYASRVDIFGKAPTDKLKTRRISMPTGIASEESIKEFLEEHGIRWPLGTSLYYDKDRGYGVVTHRGSELNLIEAVVKLMKNN